MIPKEPRTTQDLVSGTSSEVRSPNNTGITKDQKSVKNANERQPHSVRSKNISQIGGFKAKIGKNNDPYVSDDLNLRNIRNFDQCPSNSIRETGEYELPGQGRPLDEGVGDLSSNPNQGTTAALRPAYSNGTRHGRRRARGGVEGFSVESQNQNQQTKGKNKWIDCFQLNLQKSKTACANLGKTLSGLNKFIYYIQEPHIYGDRISGIPRNVGSFFKGSSPRAAILASPGLDLWFHPRYSERDVSTCIWKTGHSDFPEIYVSSVYLDITRSKEDFLPEAFKKLVKYCRTKKKPLIISMDSNSHSCLWGNETNIRGEFLEDYILTNDLNLENIGKDPTFRARGTETCIDITLTSGFDGVSAWSVSKVATFSDHNLIQFQIPFGEKEKMVIRDVRAADWTKFRTILDGKLDGRREPRFITRGWLDHAVDTFGVDIEAALDLSCPSRVVKGGAKKPCYWDEAVEELRGRSRTAFRLYRRTKSQDHWETYLSCKREFRKAIRKAKRSSWKAFASEVKDPKSMSSLFKVIQGKENHSIGLMADGDSPDESPEQSMELLVDTHFPGNVEVPASSSGGDESAVTREEIMGKKFDFITIRRIGWAVGTFGPDKTPGPDGIKPRVLQHVGARGLQFMEFLFRASMALEYTPRAWRQSKVIFIPKPGKATYEEAKSFRPISLTSFMFKTLERVVLNEIEEKYLTKNPINRNQHAFRKGSSCDSALSDMVNDIESSVHRQKYAMGVFLDISGAFDNLSVNAAIRGMRRKGIDETLIGWFGQFLKNRTITTTVKGITIVRQLTRGTPQGGVLSPIIWDIAFDELLEIFEMRSSTLLSMQVPLPVQLKEREENVLNSMIALWSEHLPGKLDYYF